MAWPNFSVSNLYTSLIANLNTRMQEAAKLFSGVSTSGQEFTGQVRYNGTTKRLETWNGSAWVALDVSGTDIGWTSVSSKPTTLSGYGITDAATSTQGTKADNALPASSYTAADVLNKIKTVDGSGSGLDADMFRGQIPSDFATSAQGGKANTALQLRHSAATTGTLTYTSSITPGGADTAPVITDGTQVFSQAVAAGASGNKIIIEGVLSVHSSAGGYHIGAAIFAGSTLIGFFLSDQTNSGQINASPLPFRVVHSPGSTGSVTYSIRVGVHTASLQWYLNGRDDTDAGGTIKSTYTITEAPA